MSTNLLPQSCINRLLTDCGQFWVEVDRYIFSFVKEAWKDTPIVVSRYSVIDNELVGYKTSIRWCTHFNFYLLLLILSIEGSFSLFPYLLVFCLKAIISAILFLWHFLTPTAEPLLSLNRSTLGFSTADPAGLDMESCNQHLKQEHVVNNQWDGIIITSWSVSGIISWLADTVSHDHDW